MSYQALYRKYRPSTLEDVIGQDIVIQILKNAVLNKKIGHAYLFSGPRGIGKTTIAKALAKTINCTELKNGVSCEKCKNCLSINSGFNPDIIEIDAASNNGVDEIREIKNKINLVPNELNYKVYIIDEVHMLSIGAFNALLKTLEEPPEYVIFILATTDPQKVPATIISRCQCFEFHRISNEKIIERLKFICTEENIEIENEVLEQIAELSDGGLRDAIGMLDKLNAYSTSKITIEDFEKVNGIVSIKEKEKFLNYILNNNILETIEFIDNIYNNGKDLIIFTQDLLKLCKDKCINYYVKNSKDYNIDSLLSLANILNELLINIKVSSNVKTLLEINILSFMNKNSGLSEKNKDNSCVKSEKEKSIENTVVEKNKKEDNSPIKEKNDAKENVDIKKYTNQIVNNCFARASKQEKQLFKQNWKTINEYALDNIFGAVASFLSDGTVCAVGEGEVIISFNYESMVNRGINLLEKVQKLFEKVYNKHYDVAFITKDEWNNIKNEYIKNKNNEIKYEYIPLEEVNIKSSDISENDDSITSQAIDLFGNDVISIN